jgi:hypothetical protein
MDLLAYTRTKSESCPLEQLGIAGEVAKKKLTLLRNFLGLVLEGLCIACPLILGLTVSEHH